MGAWLPYLLNIFGCSGNEEPSLSSGESVDQLWFDDDRQLRVTLSTGNTQLQMCEQGPNDSETCYALAVTSNSNTIHLSALKDIDGDGKTDIEFYIQGPQRGGGQGQSLRNPQWFSHQTIVDAFNNRKTATNLGRLDPFFEPASSQSQPALEKLSARFADFFDDQDYSRLQWRHGDLPEIISTDIYLPLGQLGADGGALYFVKFGTSSCGTDSCYDLLSLYTAADNETVHLDDVARDSSGDYSVDYTVITHRGDGSTTEEPRHLTHGEIMEKVSEFLNGGSSGFYSQITSTDLSEPSAIYRQQLK